MNQYNYVDWPNRNKPYPFLKKALDLFKQINGQVIVEVGSMRGPIEHDLDDYSRECCLFGHSTALFAPNCNELHTVDIDKEACRLAYNYLKSLNLKTNWNVYNGDGIEFLRTFNNKIDLLFLDAWDVDTPRYAENHFDAFQAAESKLNDRHIILIDDTDINWNRERGLHRDDESMAGKGAVLIPYLLQKNYKVQFKGRQTCLTCNI